MAPGWWRGHQGAAGKWPLGCWPGSGKATCRYLAWVWPSLNWPDLPPAVPRVPLPAEGKCVQDPGSEPSDERSREAGRGVNNKDLTGQVEDQGDAQKQRAVEANI